MKCKWIFALFLYGCVLACSTEDSEQFSQAQFISGLICSPNGFQVATQSTDLDIRATLFDTQGGTLRGDSIDVSFGSGVLRAYSETAQRELNLSGDSVLSGELGHNLSVDCNVGLSGCFVEFSNATIGNTQCIAGYESF